MSDSRSKFGTNRMHTPTKLYSERAIITPNRPTRDTETEDVNKTINFFKGITVLVNVFAKKQLILNAFNAILDSSIENDCLIPKKQDIALLTNEEKQQWDNMSQSQGFFKMALVSGCFVNRLSQERQKINGVFQTLKDIFYEVKDTLETNIVRVVQILAKLQQRRLTDGLKELLAQKGQNKIISINKRLATQFVKIMNKGLKSTTNEIFIHFFQQFKQTSRIHHQKSHNTLNLQGNAILKILQSKKQLDVKSAYFQWFLKSAPGQKEIKKIADQVALYDTINYQTAGWRLFRLKPQRIHVDENLKRKTLLFNQILKRLTTQRLANSLNSILIAGFQSKRLDVIRRIMIMALRKQYLAFNIWHRKILRYQLQNTQTSKFTQINSYFSRFGDRTLKSLKQSFQSFKNDLQQGHKKKVQAIQQMVTSKNSDFSKMLSIWKNYMVASRVHKQSGYIVKGFESINNSIRSTIEQLMQAGNSQIRQSKRTALEKLFANLKQKANDSLSIWRQNAHYSKYQNQLLKQQEQSNKKLKLFHARLLVNTINELKKQKLQQSLSKFQQNQLRNKKIKDILQRMIRNRSDNISIAWKKVNDLRLTKKTPFSNQQRVRNSIKLQAALHALTTKRLTITFKSFTDQITAGRNFKQMSVMRLVSTTNQMRKRMYNRWSRIIIQDQNTLRNKSVNNSFELLLSTIKGIASYAISHNNERRKKQHALVRIFRNLMLNQALAFQHWNKITVQRLLVKQKKGKKKYLQALKMVVSLDILFKNRQKQGFDKIQQYQAIKKASTSSRGAVFYSGLIYVFKHMLRKTIRRFTDNTIDAQFKKLKLLYVMQQYQLLNRSMTLSQWFHTTSMMKLSSKLDASQSSVAHTRTVTNRVIYESRREDQDD